MTSPLGRWCTTTFGSGAKMAPGTSGTTWCVAMCGWPRASTANPGRGVLIVKRSKPPKQGDPRRRYPPTRQRPHTPDPRRSVRVAAGGGGHGRQCARPCWGDAAVGCPPVQVFPTPADLGGSGLWRSAPRVGVGATAPAERPLGHGQTARGGPRASSCCRSAGLWNGPLGGLAVTVDEPKMTST